MTAESYIILLEAVALGLLPIFLVFHWSKYAYSKFRSQLWELRDDLTDDFLNGTIEWSPEAEKLLRVIETYIREAPRHSFADVRLAILALKNLDQLSSLEDDILGPRLNPTDRQRMAAYLNRLVAATSWHLVAGSPSGWLAWTWATLRQTFSGANGSRQEENGKSLPENAVRVELVEMPRLMPSHKRRPDPQPGPLLAGRTRPSQC